ncbi:SMI1/KNR4 family protein [Clostridium sp. CT7]|nr:SMI1/KNR4 family protein [Clostridium sp. CT7]
MKIDETSIILPKPSNERIEWFEKTYRIDLPIEYKEFLQNFNGCKPITNILNSNGREYVIERFLCLLDKPKENEAYGWYDLTSVLTQLDCRLIDDEDLIGMNVIPIAALFAGDFICLDYRKNINPCVVVWNHEESDDFEPVTEEVADNVNQFFNMLLQ